MENAKHERTPHQAYRTAKSLPKIVEASELSMSSKKRSVSIASSLDRLTDTWKAHRASDRMAQAGDGALCAIGLLMLGAAVLAYFGVI